MKKPVIGILATSNYMLTNDSFLDTYRYGNNYINRIVKNGGVPLLIPLCNNEIIKESLDMCDGLLLPGGDRILPVNFDIVDYYYKKDKPILGICLGMQTLGMYSIREKRIINKNDSDVNHWFPPLRVEIKIAHENRIVKGTKLYDILKKEKVMVNSIHNYHIEEVGKDFIVSSLSSDGIIEGIEAKNKRFVIGIQWHAEILDEFNDIFKRFVNECKK